MEIQVLQREHIDIAKWNHRVAVSGNGLPYALSNYLDIVTKGKWNAMVCGDYEAIFPLPFEKKLGLKMYLHPPFVQQLGLISEDMSEKLLSNFLEAIPRDYSRILLKGNETNLVDIYSSIGVRNRSNLLLELNNNYECISSQFSKSLRKRIRKSQEYYRISESTDIDYLVDYYKEEMDSRVGLKEDQYKVAIQLFEYLLDNELGKIYLATKGNDIDGVLFVMTYQHRIINLFGTSNQQGKKCFAMHCILNHIILSNSNRDLILDFEGSDLKGVKEFYKSFGPREFLYPEYFEDRLPFWFRMIRKAKNMIS